MAGMVFQDDSGTHGIAGAGAATTPQLRQMAANAVRLRLPYQLDFRLDTVLDPDGIHIVSLRPAAGDSPFDYDSADEAFARCYVHLKFLSVAGPFEMTLDFRVRDYLTLDPVGGERRPGVTVEVPVRHLTPDSDSPVVSGGL